MGALGAAGRPAGLALNAWPGVVDGQGMADPLSRRLLARVAAGFLVLSGARLARPLPLR